METEIEDIYKIVGNCKKCVNNRNVKYVDKNSFDFYCK